MHQVFLQFDVDNSGELSKEEFRAVLLHLVHQLVRAVHVHECRDPADLCARVRIYVAPCHHHASNGSKGRSPPTGRRFSQISQ